MDDRVYKFLKWTAITLAVGWIGWSLYDGMFSQRAPGDAAYFAAETLFEDGDYDRALEDYDRALSQAPGHVSAMRGRARTLMQLDRFEDALAQFNIAIAKEESFGGTYANRGILKDRMGLFTDAIADYERALELDPEIAEGPHWLTRFLRNQPEKPPGIADRARYLREQLAKPESERVLRVPEIDASQRSYKK